MSTRLIYTFLSIILGVITVNAKNVCEGNRFLSIQQIDKNTEVKANLRQAKYMMDHNNNYVGAKKKLERVIELDPSNNEAINLLTTCNLKIVQARKIELAEFQNACKKNTISALRSFVEEYPNSEFRKDAEERIKDYELWNNASKENTIASYKYYLERSNVLAYKEDAKTAIEKIKEDQAWERCINSDSEIIVNDFISNYPQSSHFEEAKYKLDILKGERMYKEGFPETAYLYLTSANSYRALTGNAAIHYAELKEKNTFKEILASSDIDKVRRYLNSLSFSSPYYNETSNHLALLLGAKLSAWSSEYNMNEALSYAKDESTRTIVKNYINQAKELQRTYERQRKARARKAWWKGRVSLGWNIVNLGTNNFDSESNDFALNHVGTGLRLRFGRYSDFINIIFGLDYQCYYFKNNSSSYYDYYYDYDYYDDYYYDYDGSYNPEYERDYISNGYVHSIVAVANLRFNLIKLFSNAKLYIGCAGLFGISEWGSDFLEESLNKNSVAIEPQIGGQGKKLDFGLYYRTFTDKGGPLKYKITDNNHWGLYVTWYF